MKDATPSTQPPAVQPSRRGTRPVGSGSEPARPLRALCAVLGDLADLRYNARWIGLPASYVGAPHPRFRIFILARRTLQDALASDSAQGGATLDQVRARLGTIALSHQVIDLVLKRGQPSAEATLALIASYFDAGDASHRCRSMGTHHRSTCPGASDPDRPVGTPASPAFVEWLMGLEADWATDPIVGLTHNQQLTALGNGVVPLQAAVALRHLRRFDTRH